MHGIKWAKDMEHVRLRPAMYIGSCSSAGAHEAVRILLDNVADELGERHAMRLDVALEADGSVLVAEDGRGIPVHVDEQHGMSLLELVFTKLGACFCACEEPPGHRSTLHGVGVSVLNALCEWLVVETSRDGLRYRIRFERGEVVKSLECLGETNVRGTTVRFRLDPTIFEPGARLDRVRLEEELRAIAALIPGSRTALVDRRLSSPPTAEFHYPRGLGDFVNELAEAPRLAVPIVFGDADDEANVSVAIQRDASDAERVVGFVNLRRVDGGAHVDGLRRALAGTEGLRAVVAVWCEAPAFDSTRSRLIDESVSRIVERACRRAVTWPR